MQVVIDYAALSNNTIYDANVLKICSVVLIVALVTFYCSDKIA